MHDELTQFIHSNVPQAKAEHRAAEVGDDTIFVEPSSILPVCRALKESPEWDFNVLQVISGCDYPDRIEVSYILASFHKNNEVIVKVKLPKDSSDSIPEIDSITSLWSAANFQERECFDMIGVRFKGHPDHRRILCPDDWEGHPLRKDYKVQEKYRHMVVDPPNKTNTDDHFFGDRMKRESDDPKKISVSWKIPEFPKEEEKTKDS